jgi:hypothetical protein
MDQRRSTIIFTLNIGALAGYTASVFCMDNWMEITLKDMNGNQFYNDLIGYFNVNHLTFAHNNFDNAAILLLREITRLTKLTHDNLHCVSADEYNHDGNIEIHNDVTVAMLVPSDDEIEPYEDGIVQVSRLVGNVCNFLRKVNDYFI